MSRLWLKSGTAAALAVSLSTAAFAQSKTSTTVAAPQSVAQTTVKENKSVLAPIGINALSFLYGPSVTDPGKKQSADSAINALQGITTRTFLKFSYKIDKQTSITPTLDFDYQLTDPNSGGLSENQFRWRDCFVKVNRAGLLKADLAGNDFILDTDVRFYVPTGKTSRTNGNLGGLRLDLMPSLQLGKSKFSLSALAYGRYWLQTTSVSSTGRALPRTELYIGPQINYQAGKAVNAFVLYEATTDLMTNGVWDVTNYAVSNSDIEPGVDLTVHERVTITPFLNWYTNQSISTTSMNVAASIKLL